MAGSRATGRGSRALLGQPEVRLLVNIRHLLYHTVNKSSRFIIPRPQKSCLPAAFLLYIILFINHPAPEGSAEEVGGGGGQKGRDHAALAQTSHEGHDGIIDEDDHHRKAQAHGSPGPLGLDPQGHPDQGEEEAGQRHGEPAVDFHLILAGGHVLPLQDVDVHLQFPNGHLVRIFLVQGDGLGGLADGQHLFVEGHSPSHPVFAGQVGDGAPFHDPGPLGPFGLRSPLDPGHFPVVPILDGDVLHHPLLFVKGPGIGETDQLALGHLFDQHMVLGPGFGIPFDLHFDDPFIFTFGRRHNLFRPHHGEQAHHEAGSQDGSGDPAEAEPPAAHSGDLAVAGQLPHGEKSRQQHGHREGVVDHFRHEAQEQPDQGRIGSPVLGDVLGHPEQEGTGHEDGGKGSHPEQEGLHHLF